MAYFEAVKKIGIIGGGLAGLTCAIVLARKGLDVFLFEEKKYPFHRVCGEYISNEVIPFLEKNGLYPEPLKPVSITNFVLSSPAGRRLECPLDLGGFGISRYVFDRWLSQEAIESAVTLVNDRVTACSFSEDEFKVETRSAGSHSFDLVIGAFGKRSTLDKQLNRSFISKRSPYIGVKYHLNTDLVNTENIELHNFSGGYCGVSRIEEGKFNLCYLSTRDNLKQYGSIPEMEREVLHKNPFLKRLLCESHFLLDKPIVINEITFSPKEPVYDHMLMTGDSAGMITPLCGNGMAMAIHSAKILCELIEDQLTEGFDRAKLEANYTKKWNDHFSRRLWAGRNIQRLFGASTLSEVAVGIGKAFPSVTRQLMSMTHGQPF